ncbi:neutral trehalase [Prolixibacteraceae bacterium JC049]|nr:neutral trehalase [Prolixibacteraceae bacterium JC049]
MIFERKPLKKRLKQMKKLTSLFTLVMLVVAVSAQKPALDKKQIPSPVFDADTQLVDLYWKAWELAWDHVKYQENVPQSPYIDEAFSDDWIWIWDTCFMMHFCKYAPELFPGIESLDNFYAPFYDGVKTSAAIHILDNPPLFAWSELAYFRFTNDTERIKRVVQQKQYLQKHFQWFNSVRPGVKLENVKHYGVCLEKTADGFRWEGGRSGMDNTPRGRRGEKATRERPNNPKMLWVDAISQQGLAARSIAELASALNDKAMAKKWDKEYNAIAEKVNKLYWNSIDGIYYDIHEESKAHMKCKTLASYWPMLAQMCSKKQARQMVAHIQNPKEFGGNNPWVTLARSDADFVAEDGNYWRGAVWLPTAYMGIKALQNYGFINEANESAWKLLQHMKNTYLDYTPHTIWECYSPNKNEPARHGSKRVRPDFCGWSALGPISIFIENVLGFYNVDAPKNEVHWNLHHKKRHGIKQLRFGKVITSIIYEKGEITVTSNKSYQLVVNGKKYKVGKGENRFRF